MKKIILFTILISLCGLVVYAERNEAVDLLKSPDILASGGQYTSTISPMADIMNPAASALQQRLSFNLNYNALFGDDTVTGFNGTSINLGAAFPLRAGVITTAGYFLWSDDVNEIYVGTQGGIRAGFAKELYPGVLAGAGLNTYFGESWAVTADIGFIKEEGDVSFMKDMRWGVVLGELGYSGFSFNGSVAAEAPSVFTPAGGISFNLIDTEKILFGLNGDISFPYFRNIRLNVGGNLELFDFAGLRFSTTADLDELAGFGGAPNDVSALIPSFGLYFNFKTDFREGDLLDKGWSKNDVRASASATPMANGLWTAGAGLNVELGVVDETAPSIEMDLSDFFGEENNENTESGADVIQDGKETSFKSVLIKTRKYVSEDDPKAKKNKINLGNINKGPDGERIVTYMSPNNDGIKDTVEIPVRITDSRYIKGFSFIVENQDGDEIKVIENKEKRPENAGLANFFQRLFYVEKGVDIPESIRWDGIGDNGNVVPDGFYRFYMKAWDDNGNTSQTEKYGIVIDNTPPEIVIGEIDEELKIFSPNNDGNKDTLEIEQYGSSEDTWKSVIKSADGKIYKNYEWKNSEPDNIVWDGKDDRKLLVPDGVYFYYIEAKDRAGNSAEMEVANLIINTQSTPISLSLDASYFAPGIEGSNNLIKIIPDIPVKKGIEKWMLKIVKDNGLEVKKYEGGSIPNIFEYKGEFSGGYIEEGVYTALLNIEYINGNNPSAESPDIYVDKTAPSASVKTSLKIFSPNGDGKKDFLSIYQETSVEDVWYAEIVNSEGKKVKEYKWVNNAESVFNWDGYNSAGTLAADGTYSYRLYTADRAGNKGESVAVKFDLDTEETPVMLAASPEAFSPNGDKIKDSLVLTPVLNEKEGIQSYKLLITDGSGNIVKTIKSEGRIKNEFIWDGVNDAGRKVEDGIYRAAIEVIYEKGNVSNAVTRDFIIDSVYPELDAKTDFTLFSPDDDGKKDSIVIRQTSSNEQLITGIIKNEKGEKIREFFWDNKVENIEWDGTDSNGNKAGDGVYTYTLETQDLAGNRTEKKITDIRIDNRQTSVFVTAGSKGFTPNNDGNNDKIEFSTIATLKDGVDNWEFVIRQDGTKAVKSFSGNILPEKIIWDGRDESGKIVEGNFKAEYKVRYVKGNEPVSVTKEFVCDISAPVISVMVSPRPFSPDNDGIDDELEIKINAEDSNKIDKWSLEIVDRQGNSFVSFNGTGKPTDLIVWDGIGKTGELVIAAEDYPYRLTATDEYGNKAQEYGVIPVDVLVVKEGDKLKIRIANITFAPDSAELRKDDHEIKEKNEYVLGRLSEILEKYKSYKILIEGHAVSVYWANPERAAREESEELLPLSKARAETVKMYLEKLGIAENRMTTEGIGGKNPIVPHGDMDNRWKNRRVEFILIK